MLRVGEGMGLSAYFLGLLKHHWGSSIAMTKLKAYCWSDIGNYRESEVEDFSRDMSKDGSISWQEGSLTWDKAHEITWKPYPKGKWGKDISSSPT